MNDNLANNSQDSDGQDTSSFQIGVNGMGHGDESHLIGAIGVNQQNQFDNLLQKHQDATLNRNHWVPDQKARQCFKCFKDFTFFYRKHHCRICGNVFCHNCTTVQAIKSGGVQQKNVRMCSECEEMIQKYQKELSNKNNLIFTGQRSSNYFSHDYQNQQNSKYSFSKDQDDEVKDPAQLAREQEELKRIRQIQNEIDNIDNDLKRDGLNRLLSAIEEEKNIVIDIMKNNNLDQEKWGNKLLEFVSTAVDNVKPSSRLLGDDMNFNNYIKIKIINYKDNSKSAYVNGVVLSKNLADKRMEHRKENPRILLLKDSLGSQNNDANMLISDISTVIDQEQYQVNIIKEKLTQVKPDIIIVEKDVSFQVLEQLREEQSGVKITVITNLDKAKMKRIARFTQTIISPSYNVVDKSFVLGKCKSFKAERPYKENLIKNFNKPIFEEENKNSKLISNERTLIYFEGCNPALGCTILLSGNIQTEIQELRKVKQALQEMLKLARNVVLERSFLMDLNCQIPRAILEDGNINSSESPFLITRNIQNRQTLVLSKVIMRKGATTDKSDKMGQQAAQSNPHQTANVNTSHQFTAQQIQNMLANGGDQHQNDVSQLFSPQGQNPPVPNMNPNYMQLYQQANEEKVKQSVDKVCGCPKKEKLTFYQRGEGDHSDKTIGLFLRGLIKNNEKQCDHCKEYMYKHFIQYYHKDGCIEIQFKIIQKNEAKSKPQTIKPKQQKPQKKSETKMFGFCNICNKNVTPEISMSNSFYEYSSARFFEQFFYNGDKLINLPRDSTVNCNHRSLRDISRVFQYSKGVQITFRFIPLDVYTIEMIQPKTQDTSDTVNQEIDRRKRAIEAGIHSANEDLKTRISSIMDFIRNQKRQIFSKEQQKYYIQQNTNIPIFIQPLKYIKHRLKELEKEISSIVQQVTLPLHEVDSIFGILFLERKVFINFLTFQKLLDEISKVSSLLLVLLQLRVNILKQQQIQQQQQESQFDNSQNQGQDNNAVDNSLNRGNSDHPQIERSTQGHAVGSMERQTLTALKQKMPQPQVKAADYDLLIAELFTINTQDINQTLTQNQTQLGVPQSKQIGTASLNPAIHIEPFKHILKDQVQQKLEQLYGEYMNDKRQARALDAFKIREESKQNNQLLMNANHFNSPVDHSQWMELLQNGFIGLPLGTDNLYVPVKDKDIGSIISFVLASNIYKEAMIKQNYMDISSKIKGLRQHPRQQNQFPPGMTTAGNTDVNPTPIGVRESNINLQGFAQQAFQTQNTYLGTHLQDETIKLLGKNDVFNTELSAHQIETELLCGERLQFIVKFSTDKNDLSIKMIKNGNTAKLKQTSLAFTTGQQPSSRSKNKKVKYNDYQDNVCPQLSKDYLDNSFYKDSVTELDKVFGLLNAYYFGQNQGMNNGQNQTFNAANNILSPPRTIVTMGSQVASQEDSQNFCMLDDQQNFNNVIEQQHVNGASMRESLNAQFMQMKSPPMQSAQNLTINALNTPQINTNQMAMQNSTPIITDPQEFFGIKSPVSTLNINPNEALRQEIHVPKVDFQLKIYFPKKFEALRRFYCGSQYDFIQSLLKTREWTNVSGGKSKSKFYRSFDDKYVYKEMKKTEFKMFLEFASQYFDYLCKSFFHNYPCALCKILGAYKIKIISKQNGQTKTIKKYLFITENLNFGIKPEDEAHIMRYDLKGSKVNRFVQGAEKTVLHDNNFLLQFNGRPLPIRYTINRILHICINNDTLCLSKSNIIDYSLLTVIDTKRKKVRFGIIDFVQQYTLEKIFESKFKNFVKGQEPTIVDPDKYKQRFKQAMKSYFVGMCIQEEKVGGTQLMKQENQENDDGDMSDDFDDVNDTINNNNQTITNNIIPGTNSNKNDDFNGNLLSMNPANSNKSQFDANYNPGSNTIINLQ